LLNKASFSCKNLDQLLKAWKVAMSGKQTLFGL